MAGDLPQPEGHRFSEEQVRQILERASEIDSGLAGALSASQLRDVAVQAGISEAAIDQAIMETTWQPADAMVRLQDAEHESRLSLQIRRGVAAVAGFAAGAFARLQAPYPVNGDVNGETIDTAIFLGLFSMAMAYHRRGKSGRIRYQLENLILWFSFTAGWTIVHGRVWDDVIVVGFAGWILTTGIGDLIIRLRNRWGAKSEESTDPAGALPLPKS